MTAHKPLVEYGTSSADERLLAAIRELNQVSITASTPAEAVRGIGRAVLPLLDAEKVGLSLSVHSDQYLQLAPGSFDAPDDLVASSQVDMANQHSAAHRVFATGQGWFTNDPRADLEGIDVWLGGFGIRQMLTVPLTIDGTQMGVLHVANRQGGFTSTCRFLTEALAPFVAVTVEHVVRRIEQDRREALSRAVEDAAASVTAGRPVQDLAHGPLKAFHLAAGVDVLTVYFHGEKRPRVEIDHEIAGKRTRQGFADEIVRPGLAPRTRLLRSDGVKDPGSAEIHVPVLVGQHHEATVSMLRIPGIPFTEAEQTAMRRLANIVGLAWATETYDRERVERARLNERQRIADDLHDDVAQTLFAAGLNLQSLLEDTALDETARTDVILRVHRSLTRGQVALREAIHHLGLPPGTTVVEQLTDLAERTQEEFDLPVRVSVSSSHAMAAQRASTSTIALILRAAREALVNASKHAGPCRATIELLVQGDDRLVLLVVDDGVGDNDTRATARAGHGLIALRRMMQAHGGNLSLHSTKPGGPRGMTFRAWLPL